MTKEYILCRAWNRKEMDEDCLWHFLMSENSCKEKNWLLLLFVKIKIRI